MKKIIAIVGVMFLCMTSLSAQSLGDLLKGAATNIIDNVTGGKATEFMLPGTWSYESPAVRLQSSDVLADALANAAVTNIETKLQKPYEYIGIKPGVCTFTFNNDNTFSLALSKRTLTGTYTYDAATHAVVMEFSSKLLKLGSMTGYAYIDGEKMDIVYDCTKFFDFLVKLGTKVSMLSSLTKLAENYDGMMIGFSLAR
jgi:hypothetical protein